MKLWDKEDRLAEEVEQFTIGRDPQLDLLLAPYDVLASIAHAKMLQSVGLLSPAEGEQLCKALQGLYRRIEQGRFRIEEGVEDVHSQIELELTRQLGDLGKKIHAGRSRNDQVLVALRLFIRDQLRDIVQEIQKLFHRLLELSEANQDVFLPGYTHLQPAMPSTFGLWFAAYAESLVDDLILLAAACDIINKNPLGSAAGYGTSLPIDRSLTTRLLGFESLNVNVVYAQMGRGKSERVVSMALASPAHTLSRLAYDMCLYMNPHFDFVRFPQELTTGSSIMPHKKNPDVWELIRARCNQLQALPNEMVLISNNLPSGYYRDMQVLKEHFLPAFATLLDCLRMTTKMLSHIQINRDLRQDDRYRLLFSVEAVNALVLEGMPFREAYHIIADEIQRGEFDPEKYKNRHDAVVFHEGHARNLMNDSIRETMERIVGRFPFQTWREALSQLLK